jgi:hypothetical protein
LITHQQRWVRLSTAALKAPFILTVDWLGWLCYFIRIHILSLKF